jgi:uncharacterized C2H2 Zn-finger protein
MKQYRKNKEGYFICEECGVLYKGMNNFSRHIGKFHDKKLYFDKWIKENGDDECSICNNKTLFSGKLNIGYNKFCSKKCANKSTRIGFEKGMMKKYNTVIPMQTKKSREKYVKTMIQRYGVEVPSQNKKISSKILQSMNKKYGGNAPVQNTDIFNKSFKNRIAIYRYKNTNLLYQGSFELDFLEKFSNKIDILNGPRIKYASKDGIKRVYYSDFFIPSLNLIVEIKSSFIVTLDKDIREKEFAAIKNGYNYILILNKNYNEFENLLYNHGSN